MIGPDTTLRDWIETVAQARSREKGGTLRIKPRSDALKRRLDDLEQRRQLEQLIGQDPY